MTLTYLIRQLSFGEVSHKLGITALVRAGGWRVNHKQVMKIWRQEGGKNLFFIDW